MGLAGKLADGFGEGDVFHFDHRNDFISRRRRSKGGSDKKAGRRQAEERQSSPFHARI
jgi:hypothetical protein